MEYFEFLIRLSFIWTALLFFYRWSLSENDNWRLKRSFLLGAYLLGWIIPFLPTVFYHSALSDFTFTVGGMVKIADSGLEPISPKQGAYSWDVLEIVFLFYLGGMIWQLINLLKQYFRLLYWKKVGSRSNYGAYLVIKHKKIPSPFAALGAIFLPEKIDSATLGMICLHESIHLKNKHFLERIPLVLGQLFLWFHPLQWVFNRLQTTLQEYEADDGVLREFPLQSYGELLIRASMSLNSNWRPGFFSSPLKKRIHMMAKKKNHYGWKKSHLFMFLLLVGFVVVNCSDLVNQVDLSEKAEMSITEVDQGPSLKTFSSSDQETTPQRLLLENIYREIRYPAEARNGGVGGNFEATFVIDEAGKMTSLTAKAISPEEVNDLLKIVVVGYGNTATDNNSAQNFSQLAPFLEKEIERTLSTLPDWNPAQHEGKAVPVRMNLFFQYKLE